LKCKIKIKLAGAVDTFASRSGTRVNCLHFKTSLFDHKKAVMNVHTNAG